MRKEVITRTVTFRKVTVMYVNLSTAEVENAVIKESLRFPSDVNKVTTAKENQLADKIREQTGASAVKVVQVISIEPTTETYTLSLDKFIEAATAEKEAETASEQTTETN